MPTDEFQVELNREILRLERAKRIHSIGFGFLLVSMLAAVVALFLSVFAAPAHAQAMPTTTEYPGTTATRAVVAGRSYVWNGAAWVPMTQPGGSGGGGLTDTELRASPVMVSITSGSIAVSSVAGTVAVSGPLTDAQLRASAVPVSGTFFQATQPVSGTFWQATQPVSGPLTDAQLRASAVPVSGTFWQATQPISGTVAVSGTVPVSGPLTDAQIRATALPVSGTVAVSGTVPVSGPLTDAQLRATAVPVDGSGVTQPVSGSVTATQATGSNLHVAVDSAPTTAVTGTVAATQSGTWTVQPGNTANTTAWKVDGSAVTQPVSGPLTDAQLRASPVPVSGTVTATGPLTDTQLRATPVPISGTVTASGPVTDTQLRASPVPVSGTVTVTDGAGALDVIVDSGSVTAVSATAANLKAEVVGTKTTNNAAPGATNVGALIGIANATAPTLTEGNEALASLDLGSRIRTSLNVPFDHVASQLLGDPFDNPLDTTVRWTSASSGDGTAPIANAALAVDGGSSPGLAGRQGYSYVVSKPTFAPQDPAWIVLAASAKTSATWTSSFATIGDFVGLGVSPTDPATTGAPCTDGYGFEWGHGNAFAAVVYFNGSRTLVSSLTAPTGATYHQFYIFYNGEVIYWFIDSLDKPVATSTQTHPATETLPVLISSWVTGGIDPNQSEQLIVNDLGLGTTDRRGGISDATYPWRKVAVSAAGALSVTGDPSFSGTVGTTTQPANVAQVGGWDDSQNILQPLSVTNGALNVIAPVPMTANPLLPKCNKIRQNYCR